jgi:Holliday junction DNA helicase RuvA
MLSSIPASELRQAIAYGDVSRLQTIPGIGKKTAERVVLELQEKVGQLPTPGRTALPDTATWDADYLVGDVVSALLNLGYKRGEAEKAVQAARVSDNGIVTLEALLKEALQQLGR